MVSFSSLTFVNFCSLRDATRASAMICLGALFSSAGKAGNLLDNGGGIPMQQTKKAMLCLLTSLFLFLLSLPVWAADKGSDEETFRNATTVLRAMLESKDVPADVIAKADCIIVLPSVKKFAVGIGGTGGRGPMSCRSGKDFRGRWSAPAMYTVGGASAGFQLGGTATDYVLLVMSPKAADAILTGKVKVGSDVTAAAGPGASAAGAKGGEDVLTYARTKGLFAGVSLSGASLNPDSDANKRLYGKDVSAKDITTENAVKPTPAGQSLISLLDSKALSK
jgi:lipid-binding SYLF domain-containing protein